MRRTKTIRFCVSDHVYLTPKGVVNDRNRNIDDMMIWTASEIKTRCKIIFICVFLTTCAFGQAGFPKPGTCKIADKVDEIEVKAQSPWRQQTQLQVTCLFEYAIDDTFKPIALPKELNGIVRVDEALNGLITIIRKSGKFAAFRYETLLVDPLANAMPVKNLLLVGLGDINGFEP